METYERHEFTKEMLEPSPEGWRYDRFVFRALAERMIRLLERDRRLMEMEADLKTEKI
jgi:hypothetical protein